MLYMGRPRRVHPVYITISFDLLTNVRPFTELFHTQSTMAFSDRQMYAVEITERVCSVFSLLGTVFIITTFLSNQSFHKPINRLVFFAAWGNIMSSVATLISTSGIRLGSNDSLCQFQAFLIQWYALSTTPKIEGIRYN
jgi:hypothetical protein